MGEYRGGGVSQGGLFELGEMAVSVRVFVRGRLEGFALRHAALVERRAALRASAADSQDGQTPAFFAELVLEGTQRGGKEIVTVKGARIAGLQRQGMLQFNPVSVPLSWTLKLRPLIVQRSVWQKP